MSSLPRRMVGRFNAWAVALRTSPRVGRFVRRHITVITYTGRRSGRTFSTPVGFRQAGDTVTIGVMIPDAKKWWRNFLDGGGPLALELDGAERTGHATAHRDDRGRVTVRVRLDAPR